MVTNCFRLCDECEASLERLRIERGDDVPLVCWCDHHGVHALQLRRKRTTQPCQTLALAAHFDREYADALAHVGTFAAIVAAVERQPHSRVN